MSPLNEENRCDIVRFRIENANKTLEEVDILMQNGLYNTAVNRMYYACYYAVCALLIANNINTKTHDGVRQMLGQQFIKTGIIPNEMGRFYGRLFTNRLTGDYDDFFSHDLESAQALYPGTKNFVATVKALIDKWFSEHSEEIGNNE